MNITDLIVEFIKEGNVVEFPGMGTLTSSTVSAHHDAASGTYYPARRTVVMNNTQSGNQAIIRKIAESECVTVEIAEMMWKIIDNSDYIDNSAYRYMEIIPEYLFEANTGIVSKATENKHGNFLVMNCELPHLCMFQHLVLRAHGDGIHRVLLGEHKELRRRIPDRQLIAVVRNVSFLHSVPP